MFDANGNSNKVIDARGNATTTAHTVQNLVASRTDPLDHTTYFVRDLGGNVLQEKDPRGTTTYFTHNSAGWPATTKRYASPQAIETQTIYNKKGQVTCTIDPNSHATYFYYDKADRQKGVYQFVGGDKLETYYVFDKNGNTTDVVNARGYTTQQYYDKNNRQKGTIDALGNESYYEFDGVGNVTHSVDARDNLTYFAHEKYNNQYRLIQAVDPEEVVSYYAHDAAGNRTTVTVGTGADARSTDYAYDELNRVSCITAPDGGHAYFGYDENGNRISIENPLGKATYYRYDEGNRLVRVTDTLGETAYYQRDEAGNPTRSETAAGRIGNFAYDGVNRRTEAWYDDGFTAYFAYDANSNMLSAQELTEGAVYYGYDELNRVTEQTFAVGGTAYYAYDENSNRTELTYPSGGTAYYVYDEIDRMTTAVAPSGQTTTYDYDKSSNRTKSVWGNATYTYYAYDKASRVESIHHFDSGGTALAYFDYGRDGRANIIHIGRLNGLTTYYGYDAADRLDSEDWKNSGGSTIYGFSYEYDLNGNRTVASILGVDTYYTYDDADALTERTDSTGTAYYSYDKDGNLHTLEEPGSVVTYFAHGSHGLVTSIKPLGGTEVVFGYDALLRRVRMTEGATTTYFRHDGINLLEIEDTAGSVTKLTHGYTLIDGIGSVIEVDKDGTRYHLHLDHRGTCYKITDANESVVWEGLCDAWGKALSEVGTNPTIFWYQGQAWYKKTINGRTYYLSPTRIYDPEDGRFVSFDPIGHMGGLNLYSYVAGRVPQQVDVSGKGMPEQIMARAMKTLSANLNAERQFPAGAKRITCQPRGGKLSVVQPGTPGRDCCFRALQDALAKLWTAAAKEQTFALAGVLASAIPGLPGFKWVSKVGAAKEIAEAYVESDGDLVQAGIKAAEKLGPDKIAEIQKEAGKAAGQALGELYSAYKKNAKTEKFHNVGWWGTSFPAFKANPRIQAEYNPGTGQFAVNIMRRDAGESKASSKGKGRAVRYHVQIEGVTWDPDKIRSVKISTSDYECRSKQQKKKKKKKKAAPAEEGDGNAA